MSLFGAGGCMARGSIAWKARACNYRLLEEVVPVILGYLGVSFQKITSPIYTPSSRALITRTPTHRTPNLWKQPDSSYDRINSKPSLYQPPNLFKGALTPLWKPPFKARMKSDACRCESLKEAGTLSTAPTSWEPRGQGCQGPVWG